MKKREFIESVRSLLDEYDGVKPVFTHKITIPLETLDMAPDKILSESDLVDWIDNLVMRVHGDKPHEKAKDETETKCCGRSESEMPVTGRIHVEPNDVYMLKEILGTLTKYGENSGVLDYLRNFIEDVEGSLPEPTKTKTK